MKFSYPLARLLPPCLVWLFYTLGNYHFVPLEWMGLSDPAGTSAAEAWQFAGLILPALYLASVGPNGLVDGGLGFLLNQTDFAKAAAGNRKVLARMGIFWLSVFFISVLLLLEGGGWLSSWLSWFSLLRGSRFLHLFLYFLMHLGLLSGIGVFVFLAVKPQ